MKELLGMALVVAMLGTISGVFIYLSCDAIPDQGAAFGYIMSNPMWVNSDGTVGPFYGLDRVRRRSKNHRYGQLLFLKCYLYILFF